MARPPPTVRERAQRLLSRREHARGELRRKLLEKHGREAAPEIDAELARLTELGLLSDERFARAYARSVSAKFAARRIRQELQKRGVGAAAVAAALAEVGLADGPEADDETRERAKSEELQRARALIARRRRTTEADPESRRREDARLLRWLTTRGFPYETARRATEAEPED